jgi:hypothetical protein
MGGGLRKTPGFRSGPMTYRKTKTAATPPRPRPPRSAMQDARASARHHGDARRTGFRRKPPGVARVVWPRWRAAITKSTPGSTRLHPCVAGRVRRLTRLRARHERRHVRLPADRRADRLDRNGSLGTRTFGQVLTEPVLLLAPCRALTGGEAGFRQRGLAVLGPPPVAVARKGPCENRRRRRVFRPGGPAPGRGCTEGTRHGNVVDRASRLGPGWRRAAGRRRRFARRARPHAAQRRAALAVRRRHDSVSTAGRMRAG